MGSQKSAVFDAQKIGTCTRHGIAPLPGGRGAKAKINQDRGVVCWPFNGSSTEALFCVFDGHGRQGEKVSEFCMKTIPGLLESDAAALRDDTGAFLSKQIIAMDLQLQKSDVAQVARMAGTTSTVCYLRGNRCWVACSGDSRAVLGQRTSSGLEAKDLSFWSAKLLAFSVKLLAFLLFAFLAQNFRSSLGCVLLKSRNEDR